ncbi:MAG: ornithine carbamoyltransferase [Anaerolineae bacterium]|nr:ornithine carbamoyltransferase [Anaerolineae bacterium]
MKNFLHLNDFEESEIHKILDRADFLREKWKANQMPQSLKDKKLALWFWGQGFRNRVAFEIGARSMGADVSFIPGELAVHEPMEDIAHYLNNWFSMLIIRCRSHDHLRQVSNDASIPVINARTNFNHPCEIMGDLQYIRRERKTLDGLKVVFVGECTNLCMSWFEAAKVLPMEVVQIGPKPYLLNTEAVKSMNSTAIGKVSVSDTFDGCISSTTDVLYTDSWPKSEDPESIRQLFSPYQITQDIVNQINPRGFFMPCPPITRGEEVSAESVNHPRYCNYAAKEYLLHAQNALMEYCLLEEFQ